MVAKLAFKEIVNRMKQMRTFFIAFFYIKFDKFNLSSYLFFGKLNLIVVWYLSCFLFLLFESKPNCF